MTEAGAGYTNETVSIKQTYKVPGLTFAVDTASDINAPTYAFKFNSKTFTFDRIATKAVDVNYVDANGKIIKTEQLRPGVDAIPEAPVSSILLESDPYKNILAQWVDKDGNALGTTLGLDGTNVKWQDEYNFYAVKSLNGTIKYTGGLKDVLFNISFNSNFHYNVYLPAEDENLTINSVTGFDNKCIGAVIIDGKAYYVYSFVVGTAAAADNASLALNFTAKGVTYDQTINISALIYADIVLESSEVEAEKLAIGNMARFIMEARKVSDLDVDEDRFNAIISAAGVKDYAESYAGEGDIKALEGYIHSVNYVIYNGNAYYKFVLTDASYADLIKFTREGKNVEFTADGAEIILNNARVYDIIDTLTITVDGKSATYSMLDNIEANPDSNLLKALYEFGLAAENYRAYLESL